MSHPGFTLSVMNLCQLLRPDGMGLGITLHAVMDDESGGGGMQYEAILT
jgi:hypothetical protein